MDSEQDSTLGSDKLLQWSLQNNKRTKYTKCTQYKMHFIKAPIAGIIVAFRYVEPGRINSMYKVPVSVKK